MPETYRHDASPAEAARIRDGATAVILPMPQPPVNSVLWGMTSASAKFAADEEYVFTASFPVRPGDVLAVAEPWATDRGLNGTESWRIDLHEAGIWYLSSEAWMGKSLGKERPASEMPDWAISWRFPVVSVEAKRLGDVTEDEWEQCGFRRQPHHSMFMASVVSEITAEYGWEPTRYVWIVEFNRGGK